MSFPAGYLAEQSDGIRKFTVNDTCHMGIAPGHFCRNIPLSDVSDVSDITDGSFAMDFINSMIVSFVFVIFVLWKLSQWKDHIIDRIVSSPPALGNIDRRSQTHAVGIPDLDSVVPNSKRTRGQYSRPEMEIY